MEKLKELDKLTAPDPRHEAFVALVLSVQEGIQQVTTRQLTAADRHESMAALELPEYVPETVRSAFAVTRNLWLYGWLCWPFYTLASFHAILSLDLALAIRIVPIDKLAAGAWTPSLSAMLKQAIESGWVTDAGIAHANRLRERSARMREELPEELFGASPDLWQESPQRYCRILLETLPGMRDDFAHPKSYWHGVPGSSFLIIENVHGLIEQLFRK